MHDVDQEGSFHEFRDELLGGRVVFIELGPLRAKFEGLVLEKLCQCTA